MKKNEWTLVPKGGAKSTPNPHSSLSTLSTPSTLVPVTPPPSPNPKQKPKPSPKHRAERKGYKRIKPHFYTIDVNNITKILQEDRDNIPTISTFERKLTVFGSSITFRDKGLPLDVPALIPTSKVEKLACAFLSSFITGPKEKIPALLSLPPEQQQYVLSNLSNDSVEAWVQLFEYQQTNPNYRFLSMKELIKKIQEYEWAYPFRKEKGTHKTMEGNLIDVWANYDSFILKPPTDAEKDIFSFHFGKRPYRPGQNASLEHSVANKETFLRRFSVFTSGLFEGWNEWENMVVIGGSVAASLGHVPATYDGKLLAKWYHEIAYKRSDIDIYFYGLSISEIQMKLYRIYHSLKKNNPEVLVIRTHYTVTFCTQFPRRHIQVVLSQWDSIQEILMESDIDCSAVAFNGAKVFTTQRGRFSYNHRCIVASHQAYAIRGANEYESRLMKYSRRGYYIWDPEFSWDLMSERLLKTGLKLIDQSGTVCGLRLLLIGWKFMDQVVGNYAKELFEDKDRTFKDVGLAYGPKWPIKKLRPHVEGLTVDTNYGPVPSEYKVIDVVDHNSIFDSKKHKLHASTTLRWRYSFWHHYILLECDKIEIIEVLRGVLGIEKNVHRTKYHSECTSCRVFPSFCVIKIGDHLDYKNFLCKKCYAGIEKGLSSEHVVYFLKYR